MEQFGRVLIEAMACGIPVIGTRSGAIPLVIGQAGLIVPEGRARELADAMTALQDPKLRQELGCAGRERVLGSLYPLPGCQGDRRVLYGSAVRLSGSPIGRRCPNRDG